MNKLDISVTVPVYNEEFSLKDILGRVKDTLSKSNLKYEIIVVNDGSEDNSRKVLEKIQGIKLVNHPYNKGYGASLKTGINNSNGNLILIIDADGNSSPEEIPNLLKHINDYDMVIGARNVSKNIPLSKMLAKFLIILTANFLTKKKIPDINSGFRVFKKDLVMRFLHLLPEGFSFTTTLTVASLINNYNVKFIPVSYLKRNYGKSKIKPISDFINFLQLIIRIIVYFNPLRVFSLISIILFLAGSILFFYSVFVLGEVLDITVTIVLLSSLNIFILGIVADLIVRSRK